MLILLKQWRLRMAKKKVTRHLWNSVTIHETQILPRMNSRHSQSMEYKKIIDKTPTSAEFMDF